MTAADNPIFEKRRAKARETAHLERTILHAVIDHVAEEHLTREQIVLALLHVAECWQTKVILSAVTKELQENHHSLRRN